MRRVAALVAIDVAALVLLLALVEIGLRLHGDEFYERTQPGTRENRATGWARVDPDLGWVFGGADRETFLNPHYNRRPFDYRANAQGFREARDFDALAGDGERRRVLMLGDSFVFGVYLDEGDTLPACLERELGAGWDVLNLGIPGWGIDQMLLAYRKYREAIGAGTVILVYTDYAVVRVFEAYRPKEGLNKPSFELRDGVLVPRSLREPTPLERLAATSLLVNRIYRNDRWGHRLRESRRIALALLAAFARETAARGETAVVVRYPSKRQAARGGAPARLDFADEMGALGVLYVEPELGRLDPDRRASLYLSHDRHPSREGNAFVASEIARALRDLR